MCLWLCTTSVHNTTQNSSDNLPSYLQTNIIAQMLSIGGEGVLMVTFHGITTLTFHLYSSIKDTCLRSEVKLQVQYGDGAMPLTAELAVSQWRLNGTSDERWPADETAAYACDDERWPADETAAYACDALGNASPSDSRLQQHFERLKLWLVKCTYGVWLESNFSR